MKAKTISYSRVFSMLDYENTKVSIELKLEEGDILEDVFQEAKDFVESKNPEITRKQNESIRKEADDKILEEFKFIVANPQQFSEEQTIEAIRFIRNSRIDELPF